MKKEGKRVEGAEELKLSKMILCSKANKSEFALAHYTNCQQVRPVRRSFKRNRNDKEAAEEEEEKKKR